ncbi:hypothetical protein HZ326_18761 [Fusarium oxysporum f. sp. albedinis]|nr:hypothetical protein HZ326_18761 [Fusarium oxysporum f. sp. albedinis]
MCWCRRPEMRRISTSAPIRISIFLPRISPLEMRRISIWACKPRTRNAPRFFHEGPCQPCRPPRSYIFTQHYCAI